MKAVQSNKIYLPRMSPSLFATIDGTYYPRQVDELYKKVWAGVDKQMFLDKALD